jgi:hypothetical protein
MPQVGTDRGGRHADHRRDFFRRHPVVEQGGDVSLLRRQLPQQVQDLLLLFGEDAQARISGFTDGLIQRDLLVPSPGQPPVPADRDRVHPGCRFSNGAPPLPGKEHRFLHTIISICPARPHGDQQDSCPAEPLPEERGKPLSFRRPPNQLASSFSRRYGFGLALLPDSDSVAEQAHLVVSLALASRAVPGTTFSGCALVLQPDFVI